MEDRHRCLGGGLSFLFLLGPAASAACPELQASLQTAQQALLEARVDDADAAVDRAEEALGCGGLATRKEISRFWLLQGAVHHFAGRKLRAAEAFVAAYRAEPTTHIDDFGPAFDSAVEVAVLEAPKAFSRLATDPADPAAEVFLNGHTVRVPVEVDAGRYTLQVADGSKVVHAEVLRLEPGVKTLVDLDVPARPQVPALSPRSRKPVPGLLIVAAAAGALAAGSGGLYLRENAVMRQAPDTSALGAARDRQVGFGVAGLTLAGVAATSVGVHLAIEL